MFILNLQEKNKPMRLYPRSKDGRAFFEKKTRARNIFQTLAKLFPDAKIALIYGTTWELLVAVELSAQCTDVMVNKVTPQLFKKYRTLEAYVRAKPAVFEHDIRPTGFYRNKTKNILAAACLVKEKFSGKVPGTMEELLTIPGVARKTANVILGNAFGTVEGIAVDTHVKRFAQKFALSDSKNPEVIERDLMTLMPKKEWFVLTYRLIEYGREICPARRHECAGHPLSKIYPPAAHIWPTAR